MKKDSLDFWLVPVGLVVMVSYHLWLLYRIRRHPRTTIIGINDMNRRIWVRAMMQDSKNAVLAVQTLRNNIMASTLMGTMAITMSSLIAVLMTNNSIGLSSSSSESGVAFLYGSRSKVALSIKFFALLLCFLTAFLLNVQSVRYYSHTSILINVPMKCHSPALTPEYVAKNMNKGSYFWSLGLRAFYFSFPLFLWVFGPIPMLACCVVMVVLLYFLDTCFDPRLVTAETLNVEQEEQRRPVVQLV